MIAIAQVDGRCEMHPMAFLDPWAFLDTYQVFDESVALLATIENDV